MFTLAGVHGCDGDAGFLHVNDFQHPLPFGYRLSLPLTLNVMFILAGVHGRDGYAGSFRARDSRRQLSSDSRRSQEKKRGVENGPEITGAHQRRIRRK